MTCYIGDCRDGLREFIAQGVKAQTCVTSPPYWGLRDYGTAQWDGGADDCDHVEQYTNPQLAACSGGITNKRPDLEYRQTASQNGRKQYRDACGKCNATRIDRQLGLEPTIDEYIANMVDVFRLVRDVLVDNGTLWLNIGDSYTGSANAGGETTRTCNSPPNAKDRNLPTKRGDGLKPKDLCGIPWRLAFALQADGWYLRSDIIWHKPNPMPESVTDRPTKSHEYLFLLAKNERYFYDAEAIKEKSSDGTHERYAAAKGEVFGMSNWARGDGPHDAVSHSTRKLAANGSGTKNNASFDAAMAIMPDKRNKRTVWTIATEPYSEAHFATFPTALVEPCILAGSRTGDIVLDPFMGSGTVAQVAQNLGRKWIGCELNSEYVRLQGRRAAQHGLELTA